MGEVNFHRPADMAKGGKSIPKTNKTSEALGRKGRPDPCINEKWFDQKYEGLAERKRKRRSLYWWVFTAPMKREAMQDGKALQGTSGPTITLR